MTTAFRRCAFFTLVSLSMHGLAFAQSAPSLNGEALPSYAAPTQGVLADIKARGTIVNGIEAQNPPFEYIDDGKIVGFDIDITNKFAAYLGVKADFLDTAWSGGLPPVQHKTAHT